MIKQEEVIIRGNKFIHTYSDKNMYLLQVETGIKYDEAYDVIPCRYTYEETEEEIEKPIEEKQSKEVK